MPDALLVMVHGSPHASANTDMFRVVDRLKQRREMADRFPIVQVGFMECNEPSIPDAIALCIGAGATGIVAVPYFLHTGTHVCDDLPSLLEDAAAKYPEIDFRMGNYIGLSPRLTDLLERRARVATPLREE